VEKVKAAFGGELHILSEFAGGRSHQLVAAIAAASFAPNNPASSPDPALNRPASPRASQQRRRQRPGPDRRLHGGRLPPHRGAQPGGLLRAVPAVPPAAGRGGAGGGRRQRRRRRSVDRVHLQRGGRPPGGALWQPLRDEQGGHQPAGQEPGVRVGRGRDPRQQRGALGDANRDGQAGVAGGAREGWVAPLPEWRRS
jgi:hypothetical protein